MPAAGQRTYPRSVHVRRSALLANFVKCMTATACALSRQDRDGQDMWHVWREESYIQGFSGGRNHLQDPGVDGRMILKWIFERLEGGGAWTGSIWPRIGTGRGNGLFWVLWWTFGFHKMRGLSWVAQDDSASQQGLCSMQLVSAPSSSWQLRTIATAGGGNVCGSHLSDE